MSPLGLRLNHRDTLRELMLIQLLQLMMLPMLVQVLSLMMQFTLHKMQLVSLLAPFINHLQVGKL